MNTIKIKAGQTKGRTYLPHGQACTCWLPPGEYTSGDVVSIAAGWERPGEYAECRELFRNGHRWYIGEIHYQTISGDGLSSPHFQHPNSEGF